MGSGALMKTGYEHISPRYNLLSTVSMNTCCTVVCMIRQICVQYGGPSVSTVLKL